MKTNIKKIISFLAISFSPLVADVDVSGYKISGELRSGYVDYNYETPILNTHAFVTVGKVGIETPKYDGFYAKVMGAVVNDLGLSNLGVNKQRKSVIFRRNSDGSYSNYEILQELYLGYGSKKHEFKIGRQEFVSPMISKDDFYIFANSFEAVSYTNRSFDGVALNAGYLHKMAGVWDSRSDGSNFRSMSDASMVTAANKSEASNSGVYYAGVDYKGGKHQAKLWNYYAKDLYNTVFAQYNFLNNTDSCSYDVGVQAMDFREVGKLSKSSTNIGVGVYSVQLDSKFANGLLLNASATKYTDGDGEQYVLGAWGGYAYFTKGFIFHFHEQNSFRNAFGYKIQGGYDFSKVGLKDLSLNFRYTAFLLDEKYSTLNGKGQNSMKLSGAQLKYDFLKSGYVGVTYEKGQLDQAPDFQGFRLIGGYRF